MKTTTLLLISILTFLISNSLFSQVQGDSYVDGPMVGSVTDSVTYVNFMLKKGNENHIFNISLKNVTQNTIKQPTQTKQFCMDDTCIYTLKFTNLLPGNEYYAVLYKDNIAIDSTRTNFLVPDTNISDFSFIIGSGAKLYPVGHSYHEREEIYATMTNEQTNFVLWLGDNIYLPYTNLNDSTIYHQYIYYKTESYRRNRFMKNSFHFGIWDDHDYSYDNGTKDFPNKIFSSKMYKTFWPHSGYTSQADNADTKGMYRYEDCDFFMTDSRWYKTRYTNMGKSQMEWLKQQLLQSTATFKFVLLATATIYPWHYSTPSHETSASETGEKDELFKFIYENNIKGVIILSGDKHKSYFAQYRPDCNSTYPLYEFMSSAFSSTPNTSNYVYADFFTQFSQNSYGVIEVSGPEGNRVCTMTAKDIDGNNIYSMSINENELQTSSQPDINPDNYIVAKYDFTNNANDNSGNGNNATVNGPVLSYDRWGENNKSYIFTSFPNTINFPNTVLDGKNNFTISFWIKPTTHGVGLLSGSSSTTGNEILIYYGSTKKISFNVHNTATYTAHSFDENQWYNVAVTRNGITGEAKIYINGELESRDTLPLGAIEIVNNALLIGNDQDGAGGGNLDSAQQFKGIMDDVFFYDTVLCQCQIKQLYEQGLMKINPITNDTICSPDTVDFIVSGATNGNYKWYRTKEGNSLIQGQSDSVLTEYTSETKTFWVSADNYWKETERKPVTITVAPKIYTDADSLTYPSELSYWASFDEGSQDETNNFANAIVNGPVLTYGRFGVPNTAYMFSNYPDIITIPNKTINQAENLTISFWIKTNDSGAGIVSAASSEGGNELLIYINSDGTPEITMNEGTKNYTYPVINDNLWHHILFTAECYNGNGLLYVDGEKAITKNEYFLPGELEVPNNAFILGNDQDTPGGGGLSTGQQFEGIIDDLKIYRRVLTEQEVLDIFNDNIKFKTPFSYSYNNTQICEGNNFELNVFPTQAGINYYLNNINDQNIINGYASNDTIYFSTPIYNDEMLNIQAYNSFQCAVNFDSTFMIQSILSETPNIISYSDDSLCSDIEADNYNWLLNGNSLGINERCIQLNDNYGDYQLIITNNPDCVSDTSDTYTYINTNVNEAEKITCNIYPNPANEYLNIDVRNIELPANYSIYDLTGKLILSGSLTKEKSKINIYTLTKGIYSLRIKNNKETFGKVFEKE